MSIECAIRYTRYMSSSAKNGGTALVEGALGRYASTKVCIIGRIGLEQVLRPPEPKEGLRGTSLKICYR